MKNNNIYIASDHGGYNAKEYIINKGLELNGLHFNLQDLGCNSTQSVDYPDYANKLAQAISQHEGSIGVLICKTGIGMTIAANRHRCIRAALCFSNEDARLAKEHNNANVLVFGSKRNTTDEMLRMLNTFVQSSFLGGRHLQRVAKLA